MVTIKLPNGKAIPKAGVFAHSQAKVVAEQIADSADGKTSHAAFAGKGYCWGYNASGEVGDGTTTNRSAPVAIATGTPMGSLGAYGRNNSQCAVPKSGGAPWCWGYNAQGQLGTGSTAGAIPTPFKILNP